MTANLKRFDPAGPDEGQVIVSGTVLQNVIINGAGTATYETDAGAGRGSEVGVEVVAAANADQAILYLQTTGAAAGSAQVYLQWKTSWPAVQTECFGLRTNTGNALRVGVTTDGHVAAQGAGGSNLATLGPLTLDTWYRLDLTCTPGTSTTGAGTVTIRADDDTLVDSWSTSTADFGTAPITQARVGKLGSLSTADVWLTQFALDTGNTPPVIPPVAKNSPPPTVTGSFPFVWTGSAWK